MSKFIIFGMKTDEIREKYLSYFKSFPRNHKEISPSPLVLEGDPTTLFTSAGMQQLVPYFKGSVHPKGKLLVNSQPSLRLGDIDDVGEKRHLTFFEMLGNWSLGDYFKQEQLEWCLDFFVNDLKLDINSLWVSVFEGKGNIPRDEESYKKWISLGIPKQRIKFYGSSKNWWSRSGSPDEMPSGEIGGPDSEIFYEFKNVSHNPKFGIECHPNCECGRFLEIGNSVFIQYEKQKDGSLVELPQKNVDFGGGLERISMAVNNIPDIFQIDIFQPIIIALEKETSVSYGNDAKKDRSFRIITDHLRASMMIAAEGVVPSNKLQGYVLRKLIRRAIFHIHLLGAGVSAGALIHAGESLREKYRIVSKNWLQIDSVVSEEGAKFEDTLERGIKKLTKIMQKEGNINGKMAFDLYQTDGFPLELSLEILNQNGIKFDRTKKDQFMEEFEKHKNLSRKASSGIFKGGLADKSYNAIKLHTTTHILHQALRIVLGKHISQKGSNITNERLRFDFSNTNKLTDEQIDKVEKIVNQQINKNLPVVFEEKSLSQAKKEGALAFFAEKYGLSVKVYTIGDPIGEWFSKEVCGGPHVSSTSEIGRVKIKKQEKVGAGVIRIYAALDD